MQHLGSEIEKLGILKEAVKMQLFINLQTVEIHGRKFLITTDSLTEVE